MQKEFKDVVFDFVKRVSDIDLIQCIILFGSVARGEADRRSDVDFLVVFDTELPPESVKEREKISEIALDLEKKYDRSIQVVFTNKNFDGLDRQFVEETFREGIMLYGRIPQIDAGKLMLEPFTLIYFSLKKLSKSDKMRVKKALYGHRTLKEYKGKVYKSEVKGLVEEFGGMRTGIASVLIPARRTKEFLEVLKKFGVEYHTLDVWISRV